MQARGAVAGATGTDPVAAAEQAAVAVGAALEGAEPDVAVLFIGAGYVPAADRIAAHVRNALRPGHLVGVTAAAVIAGGSEHEHGEGLSLWAARLPGVRIQPLRYDPPADGLEGGVGWPAPDPAAAFVLLADPLSFPADAFLAWVQQSQPGVPVSGGLASAATRPARNRLLLDGRLYDNGAVGLGLSGVQVRTLVSQGCRPVGSSYTVTRADRNVILELGGVPPVQRIKETFADASSADQALMREGLHIGLVVDEYQAEFSRGDFLVRAVLGAREETGAVAVGDVVRVGQTVQFHVRDAQSADEDLRELLDGFGHRPTAGLLFTCNGRGSRLFARPHHDASLVRRAVGGAPLAGCSCAGEFGPVAERSYLHGFTASVMTLSCER